MGFFNSNSGGSDTGRTSAEGGNGNVVNPTATHRHEAIRTPNLDAVRNLAHGDPGYVGKHRA
jgi:hypothetical protein